MKKFLLLLPVFLIIIFFHSADNALAYLIPGTSVDCPHANPSGAIPCAVGKHYVGNSCLDDSAIKTVIDSCVSTASTIKTYSCASNACVITCANGYISCNGVCQTPINPNPACSPGSTPNTCNGSCSTVPPQRLIKDVNGIFKTEFSNEAVAPAATTTSVQTFTLYGSGTGVNFYLGQINNIAGSTTGNERGYIDIEMSDGRDIGQRETSGTRLVASTRSGGLKADHMHFGSLAYDNGTNTSYFRIMNDGSNNFKLYAIITPYAYATFTVYRNYNGDIVPNEQAVTGSQAYVTNTPATLPYYLGTLDVDDTLYVGGLATLDDDLNVTGDIYGPSLTVDTGNDNTSTAGNANDSWSSIDILGSSDYSIVNDYYNYHGHLIFYGKESNDYPDYIFRTINNSDSVYTGKDLLVLNGNSGDASFYDDVTIGGDATIGGTAYLDNLTVPATGTVTFNGSFVANGGVIASAVLTNGVYATLVNGTTLKIGSEPNSISWDANQGFVTFGDDILTNELWTNSDIHMDGDLIDGNDSSYSVNPSGTTYLNSLRVDGNLYDTDNTSYYINSASTSVMNSIKFYGTLYDGDYSTNYYSLDPYGWSYLLNLRIEGSFSNASDTRIKLNQEKLGYGLDEIMKLEPKTYDQYSSHEFTKDGLKLGSDYTRKMGLIAQEVQKVIPEIVTQPADENKDIWALDYIQLEAVLVNGIQELKTENDALKATLCEIRPEAEICNK